jgi:hypothetical protein
MNAQQYREAAIDLVIRVTGAPREWAEEVIDEESAQDWHARWMTPGKSSRDAIVACYVAAALLDNGFATSGEYAGDDESAPEWLGR